MKRLLFSHCFFAIINNLFDCSKCSKAPFQRFKTLASTSKSIHLLCELVVALCRLPMIKPVFFLTLEIYVYILIDRMNHDKVRILAVPKSKASGKLSPLIESVANIGTSTQDPSIAR